MKKQEIMRKILLFVILISSNLRLLGSTADQAVQVIEGASYMIVGQEDVSYFDFRGNHLQTVSHHISSCGHEKRLDPDAPKPQPVKAQISYWDACRIPIFWGLFYVVKGAPGHFIDFQDSEGRTVRSFRYNPQTREISTWRDRQRIVTTIPLATGLKSISGDGVVDLDLSKLEEVVEEPDILEANHDGRCNIL